MPKKANQNLLPENDQYVVETLWRACDTIEAFETDGELLRLRDVAGRTGLSEPTVFRLLHTLELRGFVERVDRNRYRLRIRPIKRSKYRFGYAAESSQYAFSRAVTESLANAAKNEGVDLMILDNRYTAKTALRNVDIFIREKLDLVFEFQASNDVAPVISSKLLEAAVPFIAIEVPHPGATYFGGDNYGAGIMGGRHLGRWAKQNWAGAVDQVLLLELPMSGSLPNARLTGLLAGISDILPRVDHSKVIRLNGNGQFGRSLEVVRKHLRRTRAGKTLVGAINDPSALGALRAFEEAGKANSCAVVSHNASADGRAELRQGGTRLIASVGFSPELYGEALIALAFDILREKPVPPAVFVKHQLVTPENVDQLYPNDVLMTSSELDSLLLRGA
jgi:ribose transport system substrate-binding protein